MCILWGILSIREPQGSFISLISPQTGHSLAQSLSPMPSRMTDPEFVKVNQTQIPDLTMQKLKPWKVEWLAQDYTDLFWWSWDHPLSSPDPQSILFYVFKGKQRVFHTLFPLHLTCSSSFKWPKSSLSSPASKKQMNIPEQRSSAPRWALALCPQLFMTPRLKPMKNRSFSNPHHLLSNIMVRTLSNRDQRTTDLFSFSKGQFAFGNTIGMGSWK